MYLIIDIVRGWSGLHRHHPDKWWAKHLKVSPPKVHYIKKGRGRNPGIIPTLEQALHDSHTRLEGLFRDKGIIT
jgi:hypothetical protein